MRKLDRPYTDPSYLFRHGGAAAPGLLDFSASINPLGPSPLVRKAIRRAIPEIAGYPDTECRLLTAGLAKLHDVGASQIVVGNGSNELIHAVARAFQPGRVAIAEPTYTEYLRASLLVGATVDHWLAEDESFQFRTFDPAGAEIVWLCNPNSPTGSDWPPTWALMHWFEQHPKTLFVVDEAFMPLHLMPGPGRSLVGFARRARNLIVLRSLTKWFALPGLRLGYCVTNESCAERLRQQRVPWSVNQLAQRAGLAALADETFQQRTQRWLGRNAFTLYTGCRGRRFTLLPICSLTNFMLARLDGIAAPQLVRKLLQEGLAIRDASNFVGLDERYVRIAVRRRSENQRLFAALNHLAGPRT